MAEGRSEDNLTRGVASEGTTARVPVAEGRTDCGLTRSHATEILAARVTVAEVVETVRQSTSRKRLLGTNG